MSSSALSKPQGTDTKPRFGSTVAPVFFCRFTPVPICSPRYGRPLRTDIAPARTEPSNVMKGSFKTFSVLKDPFLTSGLEMSRYKVFVIEQFVVESTPAQGNELRDQRQPDVGIVEIQRDEIEQPPHPVPQGVGMDPEFLRGRARVSRMP